MLCLHNCQAVIDVLWFLISCTKNWALQVSSFKLCEHIHSTVRSCDVNQFKNNDSQLKLKNGASVKLHYLSRMKMAQQLQHQQYFLLKISLTEYWQIHTIYFHSQNCGTLTTHEHQRQFTAYQCRDTAGSVVNRTRLQPLSVGLHVLEYAYGQTFAYGWGNHWTTTPDPVGGTLEFQ